MKKLSILLAASALALPAAANAAHIDSDQGDACFAGPSDCIDVDSSRSDLDALSDGDFSTFFSLGANGSITYDISPLIFDGGLLAVEITNGNPNPNFPESALFSFSGPDGSGSVELSNQPVFLLDSSGGVTATRMNDGAQSQFSINLGTLAFDMLTVTDTTLDNFAGFYENKRTDGFDLGEIEFDTAEVPAPAALSLLGLGILGIAATRRRTS